MRMPVDELFADTRTDVPERERPLFFLHTRVQSHLEQHIAQLLAQKAGIGKVDGVRHFVGLFDKILADGRMRLHLIPRAAIFRIPQQCDNLQQVFHVIAFFLRQPVHGIPLSVYSIDFT
jgi:hypothetical protein